MNVAVVIPTYKVRSHILSVVERIGSAVSKIYIVDDKCPEGSGQFVLERCRDSRVEVIFNQVNQGVGGATIAGYRRALLDGADIVVKLDGDGQMDPAAIASLIRPIERGVADYTKGNRFYSFENLEGMPVLRKIGNTGLSFITKVSSGYWDVMDPTNGYTAIHAGALSLLPLSKIEKRYFFESDMLFDPRSSARGADEGDLRRGEEQLEHSQGSSRFPSQAPLSFHQASWLQLRAAGL
jgi:glycosyltransferase involved in cell wall biosynthesis